MVRRAPRSGGGLGRQGCDWVSCLKLKWMHDGGWDQAAPEAAGEAVGSQRQARPREWKKEVTRHRNDASAAKECQSGKGGLFGECRQEPGVRW